MQEIENVMLKKQISEIEDALNPQLLFTEPLSVKNMNNHPKGAARVSTRIRKAAKVLVGIRKNVTKNINKRLSIFF